MVSPSSILSATSLMQVVRDVADVAGAAAGVICAVIAARNIHRDYRRAPSASARRSVASKAKELIIVIQTRSWVLLVLAAALITFGSSGTHKLILSLWEPSPPTARSQGDYFPVLANYHPSGLMGDIGDLRPPARMAEADRFTYEPLGEPPHEWNYKYLNGTLNEKPAQFAGVMYLHPRDNWGTDPVGGYDLRKVADVIRWEARSVEGNVNVEFLAGGVTWVWDEAAKRQMPAPYPDSLPATSLGTKNLTPAWTVFEVDLRASGRVTDDFKKVVGGFGWIITWAANDLDKPDSDLNSGKTKIFTIEIRNIRYERKQR